MTPQQRMVYAALRALGSVTVDPCNQRPLKNLWRRGLVRYRRQDGVRVAVWRRTASVRRRLRKLDRLWDFQHEN